MKLNWTILSLILICLVLFGLRVGVPTVFDQDEAQILASAQEMAKSGAFITPHLNFEVYFHKPPLYAWLTALLFKLFFVNEFLGRLWSVIFATATVALTYYFGQKLFGRKTGLLSAIILATSPLFIVLARMGMVDPMLTFFITLSLFCFYSGFKDPKQKHYFYLSAVSMGLATMAKGPLGIFLPGAMILMFLYFKKRFDLLKQFNLFLAALIYFAIAAPWYIYESTLYGFPFLETMFGDYMIGIYSRAFQGHSQPIYYYLIIILLGFFPWSLFLPVAFSRVKEALLGVWFILILVLFSLASTKIAGYILPLFPAAALLVGRYFDLAIEKNKKNFKWFVIMATAMAALMIGLAIFAMPMAEEVKFSKPLALAATGRKNICSYKTWMPPSFFFYTNLYSYPTKLVKVSDEKELRKFMRSKEKALCLIQEKEHKELKYKYKIVEKKAGFLLLERR